MMVTSQQLLKIIEQQIAEFELPAEPALLYQPIAYILEDGGKRMRPLLTLLAADAFDPDGKFERAMSPALSIEVFHNFTLLHDDIMDRSDMRRSRPTVHCKWSENVAILSGDAMLILAYKILSHGAEASKLPQLLEVFNRAAMEVCQGQQMDMDFETQDDVTIWDYMRMIQLKTAVLMAAALKMGAVVAGATKEQCDAIYEFGVNLGLAFQIQDDYLDTFGDAKTFGKKIGGDIAVGKKTFLYLTALERANQRQRGGLQLMDDMAQRLPRVQALYQELEVDKMAEMVIGQYFNEAILALESCNLSPERLTPLKDYAHSLLNRQK